MSKKILLVDDEEDIVKPLKFRLESKGYQVVVAGDGEAALKKHKSEKPDLIILDLMLPKLDGYSVAKRIRERESSGEHVPIIMLTGRTTQSDGEAGFEAGTDVYLKKPFEADKLLILVEKCLKEEA
ncbi:response regulator transcription factor [Candidatus Margulisiibacteriota bacterium]